VIFKQHPKTSAELEAQHHNWLLAGALATAGQKVQQRGSALLAGLTHPRPQSWMQEFRHLPSPWGITGRVARRITGTWDQWDEGSPFPAPLQLQL